MSESNEEPVVGDAPPNETVLLSNAVYDKLKPVVQYVLPAFAALYLALAPLWDLPKQEEVAGTVAALSAFMGVVLAISHKQYTNSDARFDGNIVVSPNADGNSDLNVSLSPLALASKKEVVVKVNRV